MTAKLFCTERVMADGSTYAGPNIIAADWPEAQREALARGVAILGELVAEIPADAPPGVEIGVEEIMAREISGETKQ